MHYSYFQEDQIDQKSTGDELNTWKDQDISATVRNLYIKLIT